MGDTKKVHTTGRFRAQYGRGIKHRVLKIELLQYAKHICPYCEKTRIKRSAAGIFYCRSCGKEFTGGAYTPNTMSGRIVKRMVSQRQFLPLLKELTATKEAEKQAHTESFSAPKEKRIKKPRALAPSEIPAESEGEIHV